MEKGCDWCAALGISAFPPADSLTQCVTAWLVRAAVVVPKTLPQLAHCRWPYTSNVEQVPVIRVAHTLRGLESRLAQNFGNTHVDSGGAQLRQKVHGRLKGAVRLEGSWLR